MQGCRFYIVRGGSCRLLIGSVRGILGELAETGAEFCCLFRLLRGQVMLLAGVGAQVVELLTAALAVGAASPHVRYVLELPAAQGIARSFEGLSHQLAASPVTASQQGRQMVLAVSHGALGHFDAAEAGQRAAYIHLAHEGGIGAGGNGARPGDNEGNAGTAFEEAVFATTPRSCRLVLGAGFACAVLIAIRDYGAVVAGEDDEGFFRSNVEPL